MSSPGVDGDPKPPCLPRNGLVKLPGQPNGLGAASITKGTPAARNRPCQPLPPPTLPPPSLAAPLPRAALAGGLCPPAGIPLGGPASAPAPGPPVERPPLATDEKILNGLFWYFSACEKCVLAQVCKAWRRVLYQPKFWAGLTPVLHAKELYNVLPGGEKEFVNLQGFAARGFEGFCLVGVSDLDICEFIDNYALSKKGVKAMSLKRSTITDAGLEVCTHHGHWPQLFIHHVVPPQPLPAMVLPGAGLRAEAPSGHEEFASPVSGRMPTADHHRVVGPGAAAGAGGTGAD
uniref:F-box and leucine rich repeat protein 16 n=1 Tax=Molossus molossus TaxID=27622 RepID=A0A7J8IXS0_MOLMO|nr:F-box and leucine rich repeat protein 16 [Molossus molossus]